MLAAQKLVKKALSASLLSLLLLWFGGCASMAGSPETYTLEARFIPQKPAKPTDRILLIALPTAEPGFDTRRMAYTETLFALEYYTKSEWADRPARLLLPLVVSALESTGAFRAVVAPPTPIPGDVRLDLDIIRFQQDFLEKPSRMHITFRANLIDMATLDVLATRLFEAVEIAPSDDAYGGVQAANAALPRLLEALAEFVLAYAV
jgi:cholesterol transport system auxiliary component